MSFIRLSLFLLLVAPFGASAQCKCPPLPKTAKEALEQSSVAFVGRTEKIEKSGLHKDYNEITFVILRRFKGFEELKGETMFMFSPIGKEQCAPDLIMGQDYMVYGTGNPAKYLLTSCSRTGVLDSMLDDVEQLSSQATVLKK